MSCTVFKSYFLINVKGENSYKIEKNHTHVIFYDDGTDNPKGEYDFRSGLEKRLRSLCNFFIQLKIAAIILFY
jgi:hypothetical protein